MTSLLTAVEGGLTSQVCPYRRSAQSIAVEIYRPDQQNPTIGWFAIKTGKGP